VSPDPDTRRPGGPLLAVATAVLYTTGMSVIWIVSRYRYDDPSAADDAALSLGLAPLILVVAWLARRAGLPGPRPPASRWPRLAFVGLLCLLVPLPGFPLAIALGAGLTAHHAVRIALSLVASLLVGVGEELAYRGIVLNALLQRYSAPAAVALSSVLFALLHTCNLLAGREPAAVLFQVILTAATGSIFAWTYLLTGRNLALVMLLHGLYDFGLAAADATPYGANPLTLLNLVVIAATTVALAIGGVRWSRAGATARA
jgi:membrane protease YdiL (CAAX protease family)